MGAERLAIDELALERGEETLKHAIGQRLSLVAVSFIGVGFPMVACNSQEDEVERFLKLPMPERHEVIRTKPAATQLKLYQAALRRKHPPDLELGSIVAERGAAIVPLILEELRTLQVDARKADLFWVLEAMQREGHYCVGCDESSMEVLNDTVAAMESPWKAEAERSLREIAALARDSEE